MIYPEDKGLTVFAGMGYVKWVSKNLITLKWRNQGSEFCLYSQKSSQNSNAFKGGVIWIQKLLARERAL
jgi:hypothetical protein